MELLKQVPPLGVPIEPGPGWRRLDKKWTKTLNPEQQALELKQTLTDVIVGFIPVVGDAVDIAEFVYGVITGEDKWGNPLSTGDLALLGIGAVLPFMSGAAARGSRLLVQKFADQADDAGELAQRVKKANLSSEDKRVIHDYESAIKKGQIPPTELVEKALGVLRRIEGQPPTIEALLNADRTGFAHIELQAAYKNYEAKQIRKKEAVQGPVEWARDVTRGRPRQLFEILLGKDYAKVKRIVVATRPVNNIDVPRPATYTDEMLAADLETARKNSPKLWERMGRLFAEQREGTPSRRGGHRQTMEDLFGTLKGNLGEIFSMPVQRAQLARIAAEMQAAGESGVPLLVSGVKVRLAGKGKAVDFSDNIIVVVRGNQVEVKAVFEVKSGVRGGERAGEQIYSWIEDKFTEGSQLILPKGCVLTDAEGKTQIWPTRRSFIWYPSDPKAPRVVGLAGAKRHIIAPEGATYLGIRSGKGVGPGVKHHAIPGRTSAHLDYLTASILLGRSAPIQSRIPAAK